MFVSGQKEKDSFLWGRGGSTLTSVIFGLFYVPNWVCNHNVLLSLLSFPSVYILLYSTSFVALDCHGEFQHGPCGGNKSPFNLGKWKPLSLHLHTSSIHARHQGNHVFRPPRLLSYPYRQVARRDSLAKGTVWRWPQESCKYHRFLQASWKWLVCGGDLRLQSVVAVCNMSIAWEVNSIF